MSNTIIKAQNVKLLRGKQAPDLPASVGKAGKGTPQNQSRIAAPEKDQDKWLKMLNTVKKEAYEKGFAEGVELRKQELHAAISAMSAAVTEIKTLQKRFYEQNEKEVLELVLAVARKVIHAEVSAGTDVVLAVLREAVKKVSDDNGLRVRLNPDDLRFIIEISKDLAQENTLFKNAVFEGDAGIKRGGVMLETDHIEVDARLEPQLKKIEESLRM